MLGPLSIMLRELREREGLGFLAFSKKWGLAKYTVQAYEHELEHKHSCVPTVEKLKTLSELFEDVDYEALVRAREETIRLRKIVSRSRPTQRKSRF